MAQYFGLLIFHWGWLILFFLHTMWCGYIFCLLTMQCTSIFLLIYHTMELIFLLSYLLYTMGFGSICFAYLLYHEVWHNSSLDLPSGVAKFLSILTTRCGSIFLRHHGVYCRSIFNLLTYKTLWLNFSSYIPGGVVHFSAYFFTVGCG